VLEGSATSPITLEPSQLRIGLPKKENEPRAASVSLTNHTDRLLRLKFAASRSIQPITDVALAPSEKKEISVVLSPGRTIPVHEAIVVSGDGFSARLPVEADALPPKQTASSPHPMAMASAAPPALSATTTVPIPTQRNIVRQEATTSPAPVPAGGLLVPVRAQRLEAARWELRWARPKEPVTKYQIEERLLFVDGAGELQTTWRSLASPDVAEMGDSVTAQINGLDFRHVHLLRVTALRTDGATLWESPLVALSPPAEPSHRARGWALIFGIALVVLIALRWQANRPAP